MSYYATCMCASNLGTLLILDDWNHRYHYCYVSVDSEKKCPLLLHLWGIFLPWIMNHSNHFFFFSQWYFMKMSCLDLSSDDRDTNKPLRSNWWMCHHLQFGPCSVTRLLLCVCEWQRNLPRSHKAHSWKALVSTHATFPSPIPIKVRLLQGQ